MDEKRLQQIERAVEEIGYGETMVNECRELIAEVRRLNGWPERSLFGMRIRVDPRLPPDTIAILQNGKWVRFTLTASLPEN